MENKKLAYKIGDIEFEVYGSEDFASKEREVFLQELPKLLDMQPQLSSDSHTVSETTELFVPQTVTTSKESTKEIVQSEYESIGTFLKAHDLKTDIEKVLGVAYFIDIIQNDAPVTTKKVNKLFLEARLKKPSNTSSYLVRQVTAGNLMSNGNKNHFHITKIGIDHVKKCLIS